MNFLLQLVPDFLINMAFGNFFLETVGVLSLVGAVICFAAFFGNRRLNMGIEEEDIAMIGIFVILLGVAYKCLT